MKKFLALIVIISLVASYYYIVHGKPQTRRVLRIGVECNDVPNNWEENKSTASNLPLANKPDHYAEGYDVQIAKLVAEELRLQPVIIKVPQKDLLNALNRKEIDVIFSNMYDTKENKEHAAFSNFYATKKTEYGIVVRRSGKYAKARTIVDFNGATLIAQKDTRCDAVIDQILDVHHQRPLDTIPEMIETLTADKIDGFVVNLDSGKAYERIHTHLVVIKFPDNSGFDIGFNGVCAAVRKDDTKLLEAINDALSNISMRQRQKIMDKTISRVWENL